MSEAASFFARRRAGLRAEREADARAADAHAEEELAAAATDAQVEAVPLPDLPDPDTMTAGDDFTAFMAKAVPSHLRNRALRQLWRSNPVLACLDGLNDYDDDYLAMSKGQGPLKTTYEVGKGLKRHLDYITRDRVEADTPEEVEADCAPEPIEALPTEPIAYAAPPEPEDEGEVPPAPRRMRFRSESAST
ncbi:DUF3306 domain-containing protein [Salipiger sp. IMCC34102]|uniref:DUF3306 domain-containing protein n=1 Tax=Salipiger sp. IMCC34102 TaxID=2510647 RepID=UPI00101D898A|nr:DUF3306 domain-containing protein [Salipiger sp. IMCC34102]RYH03482.1 DUF3306 domain-containing protein [Salipiger sp. IMCC34102]